MPIETLNQLINNFIVGIMSGITSGILVGQIINKARIITIIESLSYWFIIFLGFICWEYYELMSLIEWVGGFLFFGNLLLICKIYKKVKKSSV